MALFLLCPNLGWIQGQFNFTELSLRYHSGADKGEKNRNKLKEGNYNMTTWSLKNILRTFYRVHHSQMV
jgi:hypothetical protein